MDYKAALKKPWVRYTAGGIAVLGVAWIAIKYAGGGGGGGTVTTVQQQTDPALAQLEAQHAALAQQAASQASAQSFQLADDAQKGANAVQIASITGQIATQQQANQITGTLNLGALQVQGQEFLANISAETARQQIHANEQITTLGAQRDIIQSATIADTQRALAATAAHTNEIQIAAAMHLADTTALTNQHVSDNNANVAIQMGANLVGIEKIHGDVATAVSHDTTSAQIAIAQTNANANMNASNNQKSSDNTAAWLGAAASIAAAFFS